MATTHWRLLLDRTATGPGRRGLLLLGEAPEPWSRRGLHRGEWVARLAGWSTAGQFWARWAQQDELALVRCSLLEPEEVRDRLALHYPGLECAPALCEELAGLAGGRPRELARLLRRLEQAGQLTHSRGAGWRVQPGAVKRSPGGRWTRCRRPGADREVERVPDQADHAAPAR